MSGYVDGFVIPVPKKKVAAYRKMARLGAKIWLEHGAVDYAECVAEDTSADFALPFPKGIRAKPGETVFFSWIRFKSKRHRDQVNAKVMKDPRIAAMAEAQDMPFDCRRMLYGGFEVVVSA